METESGLRLQVISSGALSCTQQQALRDLCNTAYEEDLTDLLTSFNGTHILGFLGEALVTHAMWVTRLLQIDDGPLLRTAYVELVATRAEFRRRGFAAAAMRRLAAEIAGYDIAALSPSRHSFYARLGWELWLGPLRVRKGTTLLLTPSDEEVMILRLRNTPELDLTSTLSVEWREGEVW